MLYRARTGRISLSLCFKNNSEPVATKNLLLQLSTLLLMLPLLSACGSRSSDFSSEANIQNPLPPCPDSPNCVRISRKVNRPPEATWDLTLTVLKQMKPYKITPIPDEYRIESVFQVVFFRDDMIFKLEPADSGSTHLHIRSSSRTGYTDFGVNRKRVKKFLNHLKSGTG